MRLMVLLYLFLIGSLFTPAFGQNGGSSRRKGTIKVGDPAPDFNLEVLSANTDVKNTDANKTIKLSSFVAKRPVVLIFGSYT